MTLHQQLQQARVINQRDREHLLVTVPLSLLISIANGGKLPQEITEALSKVKEAK